MHLLKHRDPKPQPFIPTVSVFARPGHRLTRNKRYIDGKFVGYSKPKPVINPVEQRAVIAAQKKAAKLPLPPKEQPFDMTRYRPLPTHVLMVRGPWIKEEKGVALPEDKWRHVPWMEVVMVGERVTSCAVGDKVITGRGWRPKEAWIGPTKFYLGYQEAVVGIVDTLTKTA